MRTMHIIAVRRWQVLGSQVDRASSGGVSDNCLVVHTSYAVLAVVHRHSYSHCHSSAQMLKKGELPLKDRVLPSPGHTYHPHLCHHRPQKYQTLPEHKQRLVKALDSVREGGYSVRRAAEEFSVPKSTLHDHLAGKVVAIGHSGPPKYLTDEEEEELEEFLAGCASVGFARSRQQVLELVQEVVNWKGYMVHISHGWWDSFRRRHPNLTLRTASSGVGASTSGVGSGPGEAEDSVRGGHQSSGFGACTSGGGSDSGPGDSSPHVTDLNGPTEYTIVRVVPSTSKESLGRGRGRAKQGSRGVCQSSGVGASSSGVGSGPGEAQDSATGESRSSAVHSTSKESLGRGRGRAKQGSRGVCQSSGVGASSSGVGSGPAEAQDSATGESRSSAVHSTSKESLGSGRGRAKQGSRCRHKSSGVTASTSGGPGEAEDSVRGGHQSSGVGGGGGSLSSGEDQDPVREATDCILKSCRHPSAYKWVQCDGCSRWFHCVCVYVKPTQAKLDSYTFKCSLC